MSLPPVPLQIDPAGGSPVAYLGTFLLATTFYGLTAHIAARYVLGTTPPSRALAVGAVPALVALALQRFGPATVIATSIVADFFAIRVAYRLGRRAAALVAVVHYTVSVILGITLFNLWRLLGTMPG